MMPHCTNSFKELTRLACDQPLAVAADIATSLAQDHEVSDIIIPAFAAGASFSSIPPSRS
jgi:hypothetical protein